MNSRGDNKYRQDSSYQQYSNQGRQNNYSGGQSARQEMGGAGGNFSGNQQQYDILQNAQQPVAMMH